MTKFAVATALLAAAPAARAISMCCLGDWATSPGPYADFDTSTNTEKQNMDQDVGCATCCQAYDDSGIKYGREGTDLIFKVKDAGTFTAGFLIAGSTTGAVAGGATLEVQFSQVQVKLGGGEGSAAASVVKVYKESKFDPAAWQTNSGTCASDNAPGFRFGDFDSPPALDDRGVLISAIKDIEWEQDMTWKDSTTDAVLGQGWGMQKVYIGKQTVAGNRDTRCFHASAADLKGCTDAEVSPNGIKFQLELNPWKGNDDEYEEYEEYEAVDSNYPRGSSNYWDACITDGGSPETCATCFAVAVAVNKGSFDVSSSKADGGAVSWTLEDDDGDSYDFTFAFEDLYNRNNNGTGGVDNPSDFAKGVVVSSASDTSGLVYVCAPRKDWDITSDDTNLAFLYDPEVRVAKRAAKNSGTTSTPPFPLLIAAAVVATISKIY